MAEPRWSSDDALLADLKEALAHGSAGAGAGADDDAHLAAGRAAFTWRTVDEELAALTYDSLLDDRAVVRGEPEGPRSMVFEAGTESVEIDVLPDRILGQIIHGGPGDVVVESRTQDLGRATADHAGVFALAVTVRDLLVRFRCSTSSRTLVTEWVRI